MNVQPISIPNMNSAYAVGYISIKSEEKWAQYRAQIPATLAPWEGKLSFRGRKAATLVGGTPHTDIVVIEFPSLEHLNGWHNSPAYQALIPLRDQAADVTLIAYQA